MKCKIDIYQPSYWGDWDYEIKIPGRVDIHITSGGYYTRKWTAKRAALRVCEKLGLEVINE